MQLVPAGVGVVENPVAEDGNVIAGPDRSRTPARYATGSLMSTEPIACRAVPPAPKVSSVKSTSKPDAGWNRPANPQPRRLGSPRRA